MPRSKAVIKSRTIRRVVELNVPALSLFGLPAKPFLKSLP